MNRKEMAKLVSMVADDEEKKAIKNGDLDMLYEVVTKITGFRDPEKKVKEAMKILGVSEEEARKVVKAEKSPFGRYLDGSEVQSLTFLRNAIRIVKEVIEEVK